MGESITGWSRPLVVRNMPPQLFGSVKNEKLTNIFGRWLLSKMERLSGRSA